MTSDAPTPQEQDLALWLWACDEAIASGKPLPPKPPGVEAARLGHEEFSFLQLLDGLRDHPTAPTADSSTTKNDLETTEFLGVVRASGLIDAAPLNEFITRHGTATRDSTLIADQLVAVGLLTRYQADRLLAGEGKGLVLCGKYRVLDRLGAGGMGEVYLCSHAVMKHKVAVKILPPARAADPTALDRFREEARAVAAVDHPHIVRAYDIDADGKVHFLVMEYVEGRTLHQMIQADGPTDVGLAASYASQVAQALQHAHERGIVHRDIKPSNLIVAKDGSVKVLDLGLARFFQTDSPIEDSGVIVGTADYMAPEQSLDGVSDTRADIYSLGCTLYHLLTGRAPFRDKSVARKLLCHQFRKPEPLRSLRPHVPEGLAAVVERMTAKDPVDRYQTPAEVAAALRPWVPRPNRWPRPSRRRLLRAGLACSTVTALGIAVVMIGSAMEQRPPDNELESVRTELRALNSWFDGQLGGHTYTTAEDQVVKCDLGFANGRVTQISINTDNVSDITPLRRLVGLEKLVARNSKNHAGALSSLSPLQGLPLKHLDCSGNPRIRSFEPLRGAPLEELVFGGTWVADLSPLQGMPLQKLFGANSKITNLTPLRGAPLKSLSIRDTGVYRLEPLSGAPLEYVRCDNSQVADLSPLADSPLRVLTCKNAPIRTLKPLRNCPLEELQFDYDPARDADLPKLLVRLKRINGVPAADFWKSRGLTATVNSDAKK